ncbi:phage major capsid protein [Acinetobacter lactucae]|uniref:phage major capsid protein n=1 Tax=Acinetobacter lactucae TaxID=1785128 RepID=UPI00237C279B|nr:phage major capsid protein [Acinetobacter lactucae]MDD9315855.1 phage major capsid protein [Acinetobacter lactucae]
MTDQNKSAAEILADVKKELTNATNSFNKKAEEALEEARKTGTLSNETKKTVDDLASKFNALEIAKNDLETRLGDAEQKFAQLPSQSGNGKATISDLIIADSKALTDFRNHVQVGMRHRIKIQDALKDLGGVVAPDRLSETVGLDKQKLVIRDLIAPGRTSSNAISWVQITGFDNKAAPVPEGTQKPVSAMQYEPKLTPVQTIAHLFKFAKQSLDDLPQLASDFELEMSFGLKLVEEFQILFGDGTGANLHGIMPQATVFDNLLDYQNPTKIDILRLAMLQALVAKVPATGHVLHAIDWAGIELEKDTTGRHIVGSPIGGSLGSLWTLPVVETTIPDFVDNFLTGSFKFGAQIFDREDAHIVIASENSNDFELNMLTGRCEERLALAVKRPQAFVKGKFSEIMAPPAGG